MSSVCLNHQDRIASGRCSLCLKPVCEECTIKEGNVIFCSEECKEKSSAQSDNIIQTSLQSQIDRETKPPSGPIKSIITTVLLIGGLIFGGILLWNHAIPDNIKNQIIAGIYELIGR